MSSVRSHEIRVGLLLLGAFAVAAFLAVRIGALSSLGDTVTVTVRFHDAAGLVPDSAIKVAGVEVGRVRGLEVDFDRAVATLVLRAEASVRNDVRAEVRARSLLGEKYVALIPKSQDAPLLADGDVITDTVRPVEIDQLVSTFGPLLEKVNPEDVGDIVTNLNEILAALGDEAPSLLTEVKALLAAAQEVASIAPALKRDVPKLLADLRGASADVRRLVDEASQVLSQASPAVDDVTAAAKKIGPLLDDAQGAVDTLEPGLDDLRRALEKSDEVVAKLETVLGNIEGLDAEAVRKLLREEGVLVRLRAPPPGKAAPVP